MIKGIICWEVLSMNKKLVIALLGLNLLVSMRAWFLGTWIMLPNALFIFSAILSNWYSGYENKGQHKLNRYVSFAFLVLGIVLVYFAIIPKLIG